MRILTNLLVVAGFIVAGAAVAPALAEPDNNLPARVSERILGELSRADLDAVAADTAKHMGSSAAERIKNSFASIKDLGKSQYTELVYARDYGQTEKDFIYKIDFDKAFAFVRFLWHVDNGDWRLIHLNYKTENDLPFPGGWEHIYPK
jgi:hypothetical protein